MNDDDDDDVGDVTHVTSVPAQLAALEASKGADALAPTARAPDAVPLAETLTSAGASPLAAGFPPPAVPAAKPSKPPPPVPSSRPSSAPAKPHTLPPNTTPSAAQMPSVVATQKTPALTAAEVAETKSGTVPPAPPTSPSLASTAGTGSRPPPRVTPSGPPGTLPVTITKTLIGAGPAPIVPRRRTPASGTTAPILPRIIPAAGMPPDVTPMAPAVSALTTDEPGAQAANEPGAPKVVPAPVGSDIVPPVIRIPQGGLLGPSTPRTGVHAGSFLCEILLRNGEVTQENVDKGIAIQEERGGQIGRILVSIGACSEEAIARALIEQLKLRNKTGASTDVSVAAREHKDVAGLKVLTRPGRTVAVILATDIVALLLAALLATSVHWIRTYSELGELDFTAWMVVGPSIGLCMLTFFGLELYSPMAKSTPDEIRDIIFSSSLVHLGASLLATLGDLPIVRWGVLVRGVWWLATLFLVPVLRSLVRNALCVQPWWGIPVCVLGAAKTGRLIVRTLKAQPRSGLKPVMLLDDDPAKHGTLRASFANETMDVYSVNMSAAHFMSESQRKALAEDLFGNDDDDGLSGPISSDHIPLPPASWSSRVDVSKSLTESDEKQFLGPESTLKPRVPKDASVYPRGKFAEVEGVPVVGDLGLAPILAQRLKIPYAVLAMPGVDSPKLLQIVERVGGKFSHLLVIPDLFGFATLGVPAKNLGGILGVEVRQQLLLPGPRLAKRIIDTVLTCTGSLFVLPFLLLIAALIKLDSKGPIFYTQNRLGKDGEFFKAYKFRTMHGDGEERLKAILDADPQLRAEYEIYHKLRKDPRVTRIGRFLRKFSLDEFPQLLNVVKGDMSLVGPRPYIERELTEMNGQEKIILRAPPGMTGMWQVSDRNATSFAQRVQIDVYYVRNWSPWLDIHILAKTFGVVIKGSGV